MGEREVQKKLSPDTLTKEFWRNNERFADLFNTVIYGKEQIRPGDLRELDTDLSTLIADKELVESIKKVRDLVKIAEGGKHYAILAIENQQEVHFAMAFRCLLYDVLTYYQQFKKIVDKNRKEKTLNGSSEFLSGFKKTDRLTPCRTIVIYYGEKSWSGTQNLSELMEFTCEEDKAAFNDYHFELLCLNTFDAAKYDFKDEAVQDFMLMVSSIYQGGGAQLPEQLSDVDIDVAYVAAAVTGTYELFREIIEKSRAHGKGRVNMCEAVNRTLEAKRMEGLLEGKQEGLLEGKQEGLLEGKQEGLLEGRIKSSREIATKMLQAGMPLAEIKKFINLDEDDLKAIKV